MWNASRLSKSPDPHQGAGRNEVFFIDLTTPEYEQFLPPADCMTARVVVLDPGRDVIEQMAEYLDRARGIEAIHVVGSAIYGLNRDLEFAVG